MLKRIIITRTTKTDFYTIGKIRITTDGTSYFLLCNSMELPDKNNQRKISCIPSGKYIVKKHISPKFKECLKIFDIDGHSEVSGRSDILIHAANYVNYPVDGQIKTELLGCIAPIDNYKTTAKKDGIFGSDSKVMLSRLMTFVGGEGIELEII